MAGELVSLPVPGESADVVLSVFGVMYADDQAAAARELARVAASGARVVSATWVPGSVMPAMGQVLGAHLPAPPPSSGPSSRWGDPDALAELLGPCGLKLTEVSKRTVTLQFPDEAAGAGFLIRTAGHVVSEQERLTAEGRWENLRQDLARLVDERGERSDGHLDLQLDYLLASATKPGEDQSAIAHRQRIDQRDAKLRVEDASVCDDRLLVAGRMAQRGRSRKPLTVTDEEREVLQRRSRRPKSPHSIAQRARIVLLAADDLSNKDVAEKVA